MPSSIVPPSEKGGYTSDAPSPPGGFVACPSTGCASAPPLPPSVLTTDPSPRVDASFTCIDPSVAEVVDPPPVDCPSPASGSAAAPSPPPVSSPPGLAPFEADEQALAQHARPSTQ